MPTLARIKPRSLYPTPGWLVILSLAVTSILFLSERFEWFPFSSHKGWTVLIAVASVGVVLVLVFLWLIIALLFRCQFQFSIRTLLVPTVAMPTHGKVFWVCIGAICLPAEACEDSGRNKMQISSCYEVLCEP
jgi:glucan phosphoethanolaminetransferase (alkaline phosphatase superfamily)